LHIIRPTGQELMKLLKIFDQALAANPLDAAPFSKLRAQNRWAPFNLFEWFDRKIIYLYLIDYTPPE